MKTILKNFNKLCFLKVPSKISVFYFKSRNLIIFKSPKQKRFFLVSSKLNFLVVNNKILMFVNCFKKLAKNERKILNSNKKLFLYFFKQALIETELKVFNKLNLIGVGFKVFETNYSNILMFKLGHSHPIFVNFLTSNVKVKILKNTKLLFAGISYHLNKQLLAKIRKLKLPECYKVKGIFYDKEKITIKEGKKT